MKKIIFLLINLLILSNYSYSQAPTTTHPLQVYAGDDKTLADLDLTGTLIKWYTAASSGILLNSTTPLVNGTTYYASQTVSNVESIDRLAITVSRISDAVQTLVTPTTVANLVSTPTTGTTASWFTTATGGTALTSTATVNQGTYYIQQGAASQTITLGTGFEEPSGIAIDASGNIYVADNYNNAIYKMDANGNNIQTLSSDFFSPFGIAVDASGNNIYIADTGNNAIKVMNALGVIIHTYTGFNNPYGVAVDSAGNIYIADTGNNAIKVMNALGVIIHTYTGFNNPYGVTVDAAGNIYVADTFNNAIKKIDSSGNSPPIAIGSAFNKPSGVALDAAGNIYVADTFNDAVKKMDASGNNIQTISNGFFKPYDVAIDAAGNVYIADLGNQVVKKYIPSSVTNRVAVSVAKPIKLGQASCGVTLSSFSINISSGIGTNAIAYTFRARLTSDNGPSPAYYTAQSMDRFVGMNEFVGLMPQYNESYTISVQYHFLDGASNTQVSAFGDECVVTMPSIPTIKLAPTSCGITLTNLSTQISATVGANATMYTFRVRLTSDNGPSPTYYTVQSPDRFIYMNELVGLALNTGESYTITVQYEFLDGASNTQVSAYGDECIIVLSIPTTYYQDIDGDGFGNNAVSIVANAQPAGYVLDNTDCNDNNNAINPSMTEVCWNGIDDNCDTQLSEGCAPVIVNMATPNGFTLPSFAIAVSAHPYATFPGTNEFRFHITNNQSGAFIEIISPTRFVTIPSNMRTYSTTYTITASAVINGELVPYAGNTIIINSPMMPLVSIASPTCGNTLTRIGETISANPAPNALQYEFRTRLTSDNGPTPNYYYTIPTSSRFSSMSAFQGLILQYNTSYTIDVRYKVSNNPIVWSNYGTQCELITPVAVVIRVKAQTFTAIAYPNPFTDGFQLDVKTSSSSNVTISVYDMLGRVIETRSSTINEIENTTIGGNYPSGIYNVIVTQDDEIRAVRVVKR